MLVFSNLKLRPVQPSDWEAIKTIYREGIATGNSTFEADAPASWEIWDKSHLAICRWVAELENKVVGWIMLSPVSGRCVFGGVAEVSLYVGKAARGKGVGFALLNKLIEDSEANGIWTLTAGIFPENIPSLTLHKRCGFRVIGVQEKVGKHHGHWRDNTLLERRSKVAGV